MSIGNGGGGIVWQLCHIFKRLLTPKYQTVSNDHVSKLSINSEFTLMNYTLVVFFQYLDLYVQINKSK